MCTEFLGTPKGATGQPLMLLFHRVAVVAHAGGVRAWPGRLKRDSSFARLLAIAGVDAVVL